MEQKYHPLKHLFLRLFFFLGKVPKLSESKLKNPKIQTQNLGPKSTQVGQVQDNERHILCDLKSGGMLLLLFSRSVVSDSL